MQKVTLPKLEIFYTTINNKNNPKQKLNDDFDIDNFLHFPILINDDGTLWKHGNLYLLSKLKQYKKPSSKTLDSIANDLKYFKQWCDDENIDYLSAPRKVLRPTYLYRSYLQKQIGDGKGKISPNTVKRRIGSVVSFYRYLIEQEGIKFKFPLWEEGLTSINYKDRQGFEQSKTVTTTDLGNVPSTSNPDLLDDAIEDGGRLHPILQSDQKILMETLKKMGNREMLLGFLISLTTGARLQTVFTLRLKHFLKIPSDGEQEMKIKVGYGTDCDTKFGKLHTLIMPTWIYNKIRIYINSPRASNRRSKAKHIFEHEDLQYLFLTNGGRPYYAAHNDPYKALYRQPPDGNAIRLFIFNTIKNELLKNDHKIKFSFHDLRASYGMNLFDKYAPLVQAKVVTQEFVLITIKERMGHESLLTTQKYLNFRNKYKLRELAQDNFDNFLMEMLDE